MYSQLQGERLMRRRCILISTPPTPHMHSSQTTGRPEHREPLPSWVELTALARARQVLGRSITVDHLICKRKRLYRLRQQRKITDL